MCAGWIADSENINLEVSRLDEVCSDGGLTRGGEILHEAQADVLVEGEAVAGGGDGPAELPVPVDGFPAPGPGVEVRVVVHRVQQQHNEQSLHPDLSLLQQGVLADEVDV